MIFFTPGRRQLKTRLIAMNSVLDCDLSPVGQQMEIDNSVSSDF